jgi:hypothetical protein
MSKTSNLHITCECWPEEYGVVAVEHCEAEEGGSKAGRLRIQSIIDEVQSALLEVLNTIVNDEYFVMADIVLCPGQTYSTCAGVASMYLQERWCRAMEHVANKLKREINSITIKGVEVAPGYDECGMYLDGVMHVGNRRLKLSIYAIFRPNEGVDFVDAHIDCGATL